MVRKVISSTIELYNTCNQTAILLLIRPCSRLTVYEMYNVHDISQGILSQD